MTFDVLGPGALDYLPCRYARSKLVFRGPQRNLQEPYIAFLGGTKTYGRFVQTPFPVLVEEKLGKTCVNLGLPNAGIDAFTFDPFVSGALVRADVVVIQVLGAQNMSNRFYSVHPRRNDRFLAPTNLLCSIFPEVDFADFHFTRHLLGHLENVSPERFATVRKELQRVWVARMKLLLRHTARKSILLWFADRAPVGDDIGKIDDFGIGPLFVTRAMLDQITPHATRLVEAVASPAAISRGTEGMIFGPMEAMAATQMLGPLAHDECAEILIGELQDL